MRIGIVSPYSISVPGGVQEQVLGLARALRSKGVAARVLAPTDGPPPDGWVTPLGSSLPTPANGSVAPIAPDLSAQLRLIRAVRDEGFDVLHLHEPMVPGPCMTACLVKPAPLVGTFHAAGNHASYQLLNPAIRWLAGRLDVRATVSAEAEALAVEQLGGSYERAFNGIEVERFSTVEPWPTEGLTIFFLGRSSPAGKPGALTILLPLTSGPDRGETDELKGGLRHASEHGPHQAAPTSVRRTGCGRGRPGQQPDQAIRRRYRSRSGKGHCRSGTEKPLGRDRSH